MLNDAPVTVMLPVIDMVRARHFYETRLGLQAGNLKADGKFTYLVGGTALALFPKPEGTKAEHTAVSFKVDDIAKWLGISAGAVKRYLSDALATLNAARYEAWRPRFTARNAKLQKDAPPLPARRNREHAQSGIAGFPHARRICRSGKDGDPRRPRSLLADARLAGRTDLAHSVVARRRTFEARIAQGGSRCDPAAPEPAHVPRGLARCVAVAVQGSSGQGCRG